MQIETLSDDEFDQIVIEALKSLPEQVQQALNNIAIFVADEYQPLPHEDPETEVLGLYEGVPLTERDEDPLGMPDQITIFKGPLERNFPDRDELREQIRITVIHEVAHYFGIEDDQLHELGWG